MENRLFIHAHFSHPSWEDPFFTLVDDRMDACEDLSRLQNHLKTCLGANTASRILDPFGRIEKIFNNFSRLSFSMDPILLDWVALHSPNIYRRILEADKTNADTTGIWGNALACPSVPAILPNLPLREAKFLIEEGVNHFKSHFNRSPKGFFLPEFAVSPGVLDLLVDQGVEFFLGSLKTLKAVADPQDPDWFEVLPGAWPEDRLFLIRRPRGDLRVLFYDPDFQKQITDHRLIRNADNLFSWCCSQFTRPRIMGAVIPGSLLGDDEPFGDMGMAALFHKCSTSGLPFKIASAEEAAGEFLPRILGKFSLGEDELGSSDTCLHGTARWRRSCGCGNDQAPGDLKVTLWTLCCELLEQLGSALVRLNGREDSTVSRMALARAQWAYETALKGTRAKLWDHLGASGDSLVKILRVMALALELSPNLADESWLDRWLGDLRTALGSLDGLWDQVSPGSLDTPVPGAIFLLSRILEIPCPLDSRSSFVLEDIIPAPQGLAKALVGQVFKVTTRNTRLKTIQCFQFQSSDDHVSGLSLFYSDGKAPPQVIPLSELPVALRKALAEAQSARIESGLLSTAASGGTRLMNLLRQYEFTRLPLPTEARALATAWFHARMGFLAKEKNLEPSAVMGRWNEILAEAQRHGLEVDPKESLLVLSRQARRLISCREDFLNQETIIDLEAMLNSGWRWGLNPDISVIQDEFVDFLSSRASTDGFSSPGQFTDLIQHLGRLLGFSPDYVAMLMHPAVSGPGKA